MKEPKKIKYICKSDNIAKILVSLAKHKGIKPGMFPSLKPDYTAFAIKNSTIDAAKGDSTFDFAGQNSYYASQLEEVSLEKMIEHILE